MRLGAAGLALSVGVASWWQGEWGPVARAGVAALAVLVVLGWLWWTRPRLIGLGDVRASALALAAAAAVSWQAVLSVLYATVLAAVGVAAGFAVAGRFRERRSSRVVRREELTVPFVPPLCAGLIVGLVAS